MFKTGVGHIRGVGVGGGSWSGLESAQTKEQIKWRNLPLENIYAIVPQKSSDIFDVADKFEIGDLGISTHTIKKNVQSPISLRAYQS